MVVAGATVGASCKVPFESPLVARSLSRGRSDDMMGCVCVAKRQGLRQGTAGMGIVIDGRVDGHDVLGTRVVFGLNTNVAGAWTARALQATARQRHGSIWGASRSSRP